MAVSGLELVARHPPRSAEWRLGLITFILVAAKAAVEALSGRMFFAFLEFGMLGQPVAVAHAGGIIGGLLALALLSKPIGCSDFLRSRLSHQPCKTQVTPRALHSDSDSDNRPPPG
jgi:hypothetical protein